jgi:hypothetical protein
MSLIKLVVMGLLAMTLNLFGSAARADEGFPAPSPELIVWSARACYAEATWSFADCSALLHVIRKRATKSGWPFLKMLKQYSVVNWLKSSRGKHMGSLKLVGNRNQTEKWSQNWQQLVSHVIAIFDDNVSDPCPRADHWAATSFTPRSPMRRVQCKQRVANAFWVSV